MRPILVLTILAACSPAAGPTAAELAAAISAFGGTTGPVTVEKVSCRAMEVDPTEFGCRYRQKGPSGWTEMETIVARDGDKWILIDTPGPRQ